MSWLYQPILEAAALAVLEGTASKSATDSCALGLDESPTARLLSVVEDGAIQASESAIPTVIFSVDDTCAVPGTDTVNAPTVPLAATDLIAIQWYTDNAKLADRWFYQTESLTVGLADQWRTVVGTDQDGTSLSFTHWEVSEPIPVSMSDIGWPGNTIVHIGLEDATPAIMALVPVDETGAIQSTEATTVVAVVSVADDCAVQAVDAMPVVVMSALISAADTCEVVAGEEAAALLVSLTVTDSLAIHSAEASSILSTLSIADSARVAASDSVAILATGTVTDNLSVGATEDATLLVALSVEETVAVQIQEAVNIVQLSLISAADSCAIIASEGIPLIGQVFVVADSLAIVASDENIGPHAATAQDDLALPASEAVTNAIASAVADALAVGLEEAAPLIPLALAVADTLAVQVSEAATKQDIGQSTPISASDSIALPLDDQLVPGRTISAVDTCPLPVDEQVASLALPAEEVALLLLEDIRLDVTWHEVIWGGGMRKEDEHFLYAGSYRMGERNPDETRGGKY